MTEQVQACQELVRRLGMQQARQAQALASTGRQLLAAQEALRRAQEPELPLPQGGEGKSAHRR